MKGKVLILAVILGALIGFSSCRKESQRDPILAKRIQYDVSIKSPDPSYDWWVQNLEGSSREAFVRDILSAAYSGKVEAWDAFHNKMDPEAVKAIGNRIDTLTFQRPDPPYDLFDTIVKQELNIHEITRIRFLEAWYMDPSSLRITKEVIGVCPLLESYAPDGTLRGYMPMFWVYYDKEYPSAFQVSNPSSGN
ncbi:MAG TPA: hypothetical protein PLE85_01420 [Bacteroidales bacterium]|nr:hypothetical protein [Bacteroidales bacterium]